MSTNDVDYLWYTDSTVRNYCMTVPDINFDKSQKLRPNGGPKTKAKQLNIALLIDPQQDR